MKKSKTKPVGATSYKDTAFGIIPRQKLLQLELEGTRRGLKFIKEIFRKEGKNLLITPNLILDIHKRSFAWIFPQWAGKYRKIQVEFSGKEAPPFYRIPEDVQNLCDDLRKRLEYVSPCQTNYIESVAELLAWFQHKFVFIHPFQDYNGRTARIITTLILLKIRLPAIEIRVSGNGRKKYLEAMHAADNGDFSKLEAIISFALSESLGKINV
jgi:fido (protein-threonine AMPylation protein)